MRVLKARKATQDYRRPGQYRDDGISGSVGRTGAAGPQGPMAGNGGRNSYVDFTFDTNSNEMLRGDRNTASDIATYMNRNPSQRIALDSSNTRRAGVVRATLIDAASRLTRSRAALSVTRSSGVTVESRCW